MSQTSDRVPDGLDVVDTFVLLTADGRTVCDVCVRAETPLRRMRGLLGRRALASRHGLLLRPAGSIHTAFMRFPIDAVFVGRDGLVLRVAVAIQPWRAARCRGAEAVLELAAGEAGRRGLAVGDVLVLPPRRRPTAPKGSPATAEETIREEQSQHRRELVPSP